jgi:hypothetical protein
MIMPHKTGSRSSIVVIEFSIKSISIVLRNYNYDYMIEFL